MHDIDEFLRRHAPFDELADEAREELARATEIEFFPAGATVFRQGEGPVRHVWVVRKGAVELVSDGQVLDVLGEASSSACRRCSPSSQPGSRRGPVRTLSAIGCRRRASYRC